MVPPPRLALFKSACIAQQKFSWLSFMARLTLGQRPASGQQKRRGGRAPQWQRCNSARTAGTTDWRTTGAQPKQRAECVLVHAGVSLLRSEATVSIDDLTLPCELWAKVGDGVKG